MVRVLGRLTVEHDGVPVELPASRRARAVLAYLAVHPGNGDLRYPNCRNAWAVAFNWDRPGSPRVAATPA